MITDMKIGSIVFLIVFCSVLSQAQTIYEAEGATLLGAVEVVDCNSASGGKMVKDINGGEDNGVLFEKIDIAEAGNYFVTISYFSTNDREFTYRLNEGVEVTYSIPASGLWCYQGGVPADYTFEETFLEGGNSMLFYNSPLIDKIVISSDTSARERSTFYLSSSNGHDENDGSSMTSPWKTIDKINSVSLVPGDSILFYSGDTFEGELVFSREGGSRDLPIVVTSYGSGEKPVLDGIGYANTIHVLNCGGIHFSNLELKNDGGPSQPGEPSNTRYGIYFDNTLNDGTVFEHFRLKDLTFRNIYPTEQITDNDQTGINAHAINTSGSWMDEEHPDRFVDMVIEDCLFTRTGRHAAFFRAVRNLTIRNNLFEHVGGAGMVIGNNCIDILVENNVTNYTGSSIDSRMAGRGSGIWCFRSKNLTVQHNKFMHARGIHDSYGMHIDIGNRNVVYQYNYSEDNEGGFVEILGANVNVGYRYNLSVGDGWRKRGNRFGQIFWFSGWSGDPKNPIGSDSIFVYNNSIYVRDSIEPGIYIVDVTKRSRVYNNIVYVAKNFGEVVIENHPDLIDFDNNIWYGDIPKIDAEGDEFMGSNAIFTDPMYADEIVSGAEGFLLKEDSPAYNRGKLIYNNNISSPFDYYDNHGGFDFYGNSVSKTEKPNIGAYNISESTSVINDEIKSGINIFPNPVSIDQNLTVKLQPNLHSQPLIIQLLDIQGKLHYDEFINSSERNIIKLIGLESGLYILNLNSSSYNISKKIVITK